MKDKKREKNATSTIFFTTFLQKILSSKLLFVIIDGKKKKNLQSQIQIRISNSLIYQICYEKYYEYSTSQKIKKKAIHKKKFTTFFAIVELTNFY